MLLRYETLETHLSQELAPLYILTGDEQLLLLESADMIGAKTSANEKS